MTYKEPVTNCRRHCKIMRLILLTPVFLLILSGRQSEGASPGVPYKALIYQTSSFGDPSTEPASSILTRNLENYRNLSAVGSDVDVAVFPEYGLTTVAAATDRIFARSVAQYVPLPPAGVIPCYEYSQDPEYFAIRELSCIARDFNMYTVANVIELEDCNSDCPQDWVHLFSSNVVFDRTGAVIANYRKSHLWGEPALDKTPALYVSSFRSDLGVSFGLMSTADLLFAEPTLTFLGGFYVFDYLVPMAFKGQLPFLTPLQIQQGWFEAHKGEREVELSLIPVQLIDLANGYNGNGFYNQEQSANFLSSSGGPSSSQVVNVNGGAKFSEMGQARDDTKFDKDDFTGYSFINLVPITSEVTTLEVCNTGFCCNITYKVAENLDTFNYQFLVYNGPKRNPAGNEVWQVQVCGLVACSGPFVETCSDPVSDSSSYSTNTVYEVLEVASDGFTSTFNTIPTTLESFSSTTYKNYTLTKPVFGLPGTISIKSQPNGRGIHTFGLYQALDDN